MTFRSGLIIGIHKHNYFNKFFEKKFFIVCNNYTFVLYFEKNNTK